MLVNRWGHTDTEAAGGGEYPVWIEHGLLIVHTGEGPEGQTKKEWVFADFIISLQKQLYLGRKHTFLSEGAPVLAAGELWIKQGRIYRISNRSGHYLPKIEASIEFPNLLQGTGLNLTGTEKMLLIRGRKSRANGNTC